MFLRYYKGSCPSIEIVNVPDCCVGRMSGCHFVMYTRMNSDSNSKALLNSV